MACRQVLAPAVALLRRLGIDARLNAKGIDLPGFGIADSDRAIRIDLEALIGQRLTVYGQADLTRDLMDAAPGRDLDILFGTDVVALHDLTGADAAISFVHDEEAQRIEADVIAGCDGFHGPSRHTIPGRRYAAMMRRRAEGPIVRPECRRCHLGTVGIHK